MLSPVGAPTTHPFRPLTMHFRPTDGGLFLPFPNLLRAGLLRRLDVEMIHGELMVQLATFQELFGRPPDFVDGHQHVQLFPQVRQAVLETVTWVAPTAWVRQCGGSLPLHRRLTDPKGLLIDWLSREFRARAKNLGIATNPAFAGTYTYRANADFAAIFPGFLDGLPEGGLVMCHPGHVDAELERLDPLTTLREQEYAYFCGDAFAALLERRGLTLN